MPAPLIAIFGAAVRRDGAPSAALMRRIGYGLAAAERHAEAPILCSGGVGRVGPSEASVMMRVLTERGVAPERLIADEASRDTLESVVETLRHARRGGHSHVVVVSDGYHLPRIRLMLGALGVATAAGPQPRGAYQASLRHTLGMGLREAAAIPYDLAIVLARRRGLSAAAS